MSNHSVPEPKIHPGRRPAGSDAAARRGTGCRPDGTPDDDDRVEIGPTPLAYREWEEAGLRVPDLAALREYRLERLRGELRGSDCAGLLLFDPLNIRYATDTTNMQVWIAHNPIRACFIATEGPVVLFEYRRAMHLADHLPLVDEVRPSVPFFYFASAERTEEMAGRFAARIDDLLRTHGGGNRRLAVDKMEIAGVRAFDQLGIDIREGQRVTEHARKIKDANEVDAMRCAMVACENAMREMRRAMRPGMTENDLWAVLHAENIKRGGEWIETRLLASGPRTNPWFQECGPRVIKEGDVVAFDTDLIGPYGYCVDISRTWICGEGRPTNEQRELNEVAREHIASNLELLRPGLGFAEMTERSHRLPERYRAGRYSVIAHGTGLCDEYPSITYPEDYVNFGSDGVFEPGMMVSVEAYVGAEGGSCGVKLEEQAVVTEAGHELISTYPLEDW
jgi:Xaa-Pro aminopeptidase